MRVQVRGAREHNLRSVDVDFGDGLTVLTGVSGSGKSSLAFDTVYHEARRRFLDAFGRPGARLPPAAVDSLTGVGPAVAVAQNLLNRNPRSTVASASGLHPFLRLLFARFSQRFCTHCAAAISVVSVEETARTASRGATFAGLVRGAPGSHRTLLRYLAGNLPPKSLFVDGKPAIKRPLPSKVPHSIEIALDAFTASRTARGTLKAVQSAVSFGATSFRISTADGELLLSLVPQCPQCGTAFTPLEPLLFHAPCPHCKGKGCAECQETGLHPQAAAARWRGMFFSEALAMSVAAMARLLEEDPFGVAASRLGDELARRVKALEAVGLGYVTLDRPVPSLSRGEGQRLRLAVALSSRLEDVLHILDEPTIGLHPADVQRVLPAFRRLAGPVLYVEHDRLAARFADRAVDLRSRRWARWRTDPLRRPTGRASRGGYAYGTLVP